MTEYTFGMLIVRQRFILIGIGVGIKKGRECEAASRAGVALPRKKRAR